MRKLFFFIYTALFAMTAWGEERTITGETESITIDANTTFTLKVQGTATVNGNIIVPETSTLTIEGESMTTSFLTVNGNIGGQDGTDDKDNASGSHAGTITIKNLTIQKVGNIGGGSGIKGSSDRLSLENPTCYQGGDGGNVKAITLENVTIVSAACIGGGNGGNGGELYHGYTHGGAGGNGGNATGDIKLTNTTIKQCLYVGGGNGGNGGRANSAIIPNPVTGMRGGKGGQGGTTQQITVINSYINQQFDHSQGGTGGENGLKEEGSAESGTNGSYGTSTSTDCLVITEGNIILYGTYTLTQDLTLTKDRTLSGSSESNTLTINSDITFHVQGSWQNTVAITNNGTVKIYKSAENPHPTLTGIVLYETKISIQGYSAWEDHPISLKQGETTHKLSGGLSSYFLPNGEYAFYKDEKEITGKGFKVENACPADMTLQYRTFSLNLNGGTIEPALSSQYLLAGTDKPVKPANDPTRQYYTFKGWSYSSYSYSEADFDQTINNNTTWYAYWEKNELKAIADITTLSGRYGAA